MLLLIAVISVLESTGLLNLESHDMTNFLQSYSAWLVLFAGVLIVPFIEEVIFRLYLRLRHNFPLRILVFVASILGKKNKETFQLLIEKNWEKYYKGIFFFSAILFAAVHITNFEYSKMLLILSPIIVMPQFILGLFIGYLRVKYGFIWGFYLHALHNFIFIGIALFFMEHSSEIVNVKNEKFKLKIEEVGFTYHPSQRSTISSDSLYFKDIKFPSLMAYLLNVEEKQIDLDAKGKENQFLKVIFKSYGDSVSIKETILAEMQSAYGFTVQRNNILEEVWMLQIADTSLLLHHQNDSANSSVVGVYRKEFELENVHLNQLAETLNSNYDQYILTDVSLPQKFNFNIKRSEFPELQSTLKENYGILLSPNKKNIEYVKIHFEKND